MPTSKKKIEANRINGQKSQGPKDTTLTRLNATKHGLTADGITELDDAEGYRTLFYNLRQEMKPVGVVEAFLVESIALDMVRSRRARRLEAEYITGVLHPPKMEASPLDTGPFFDPVMADPGIPPSISFESGQGLVSVFQRYESTFLIRIPRHLHDLERLQRMRGGEQLPAPAVLDVSVHASASNLPDDSEKSGETRMATSIPAQLEVPSLSGDADVDGRAKAEVVGSVPEALEKPIIAIDEN